MQQRAAALHVLFPTLLQLAGALLRAPGRSRNARRFGTAMYLTIFVEFKEAYHRHEVVGALVAHVGSGFAPEVDAAFQVRGRWYW